MAKGIELPSKAELAEAFNKTKAGAARLRAGMSELKDQAKAAQQELDELRNEPFVDAAVGVVIAVGGGAAAGALDLVLPPLYNLGGTAQPADANGEIKYKGGINITGSSVAGAGLVIFGVAEKSRSIMDAGKSMLAGWGYGQAQNMLGEMFAK